MSDEEKNEMDIDSGQSLHLSIEDLIGQRMAVLGISGSGKTNTVAVIAEELLPHLPMTIVDIEGEYFGLKEKHTLLVAGRSEHAEIPLMVENAPALAEMSIRRGISVILDLSEYDQDEMQDILIAYFSHLWKLSGLLKSPYEIIIEEAHEFAPQGLNTPLKKILTRFSLRGRKRGIGVIVASQRSAKVEKDLLTQAGILFLQNVVHPVDLSVYKDLIPLPAKDVEQQARELVPGEAFVVRGKQVDRVHIRRRHTFHAGATPGLKDQPPLKTIDASLLEELRAITARSVKDGGSDEVTKLKKQLKDAQTRIVELETVNDRLQQQNELLSKIQVHNGPSTLEIEQATVQNMHVPIPAMQPVASHRVVESSPVAPKIEQPFNQTKFTTFLNRMGKVPVLEMQILQILVDRNQSLYINDIALWLNKSESLIRNNPPTTLMKLGLIDRSRTERGYRYRTTLNEYLLKEYPGANVQDLQDRVFKV